MALKGKRLLVMGGSMATYYIVQNAQEMGVYVVVADMSDSGPAYKLADEGVQISTTDFDGLADYVKNNNIDGIFCGPSEFNILNTMRLCEMVGLPFYATKEAWDRCGNKQIMKQYCERNGLPRIPEYELNTPEQIEQCPDDIFPVIVKPVDGCSSKGVCVCRNKGELRQAIADALEYSAAGKVIVEKFIENGGRQFSIRYMLLEGKAYPYFAFDGYIADQKNKKGNISIFTSVPSKHLKNFLENTNAKVQAMIADMGLRNGLVFIQAMIDGDDLYIHDMGYRLGGGMTYVRSMEMYGINDMKMMIALALGENYYTHEELQKIDLASPAYFSCALMAPLNAGTIAEIKGMDAVRKDPAVIRVVQNYYEGDTVSPSVVGTLNSRLAGIEIQVKDTAHMIEVVDRLQNGLSIKDTEGNEMFTTRFDTQRLLDK